MTHLHPAARLLVWFLLAILIQLVAWPLLLALALLPLCSGAPVRAHWWRLLRRTRILLLTLFLVFAYGLPGPAPGGLAWLPSYDGLQEAGLHLLRLVVLLGSLAWLLVPLGHRALMGGLWYLLRPLQRLGLPMDRSVVRLALVLEYMENIPARQDWRLWLLPRPEAGELAPVVIALPPWSGRDTLATLAGGALLLAGGMLWQG